MIGSRAIRTFLCVPLLAACVAETGEGDSSDAQSVSEKLAVATAPVWPNFQPYGGSPWTAKLYTLQSGTPKVACPTGTPADVCFIESTASTAEAKTISTTDPRRVYNVPIRGVAVWSGPWPGDANRRFVAYQGYRTASPNDYPWYRTPTMTSGFRYDVRELEEWGTWVNRAHPVGQLFAYPGTCSDAIGGAFACAGNPLPTSKSPESVYLPGGARGAVYPFVGLTSPSAFKAMERRSPTAPSRIAQTVLSEGGTKGSSARNNWCDARSSNADARRLCKATEVAREVLQFYDDRGYAGCEYTLYAVGNTGTRAHDFLNGEIVWSDYFGGFTGLPALDGTASTLTTWKNKCLAEKAARPNLNVWAFTGAFAVGGTFYQAN